MPRRTVAINVPKAMAEVRLETINVRPARRFGGYIAVRGSPQCWSRVLSCSAGDGACKVRCCTPPLAGDFYQIFPHNLLAWMFGSVFIVAIGLLMSGVIRFWREISPGQPQAGDIMRTSHDALTLKYLDGGHSKGRNEADDAFTLMRRRFHHFTFYGFYALFRRHHGCGYNLLFLRRLEALPFFGAGAAGRIGGIGLLVGPAGFAVNG